ncbi:MAG: hypothetical protein II000_09710, partial [Clostridia bacterium]|nr:hypothetical protein [Clostridia bacterium]
MKTTKNSFTWKRGLGAAVASLILALTGCNARTPVESGTVPGAGAGGNNAVTTEAPAITDTKELLSITETSAPETTEPAATEAGKNDACGEHLTWVFDASNGKLTISGSGDMTDYPDAQSVPWYQYREEIQEFHFPEGLTGIGDYAFAGCTNLNS